MVNRRDFLSDIVQYYRPLGFFTLFGDVSDEALVAALEKSLNGRPEILPSSDLEIVALDTSRVVTLSEHHTLGRPIRAGDIDPALVSILSGREGEVHTAEWYDGRVSLIRFTKAEIATIRRERRFPLWNPQHMTQSFAGAAADVEPFFRRAFYNRTTFQAPSFGRGLADLGALLNLVGVSPAAWNEVDHFSRKLADISDPDLAPIFAGALGEKSDPQRYELWETMLCYSSDYKQSPLLVLEPLNYQVSRKVLVPADVTTILDRVPHTVSTVIADRGLCEVKMVVLGPPPEEELPYYIWMHGLLSSIVLAHVHTMLSESLRLFESCRQRGDKSVVRWPGFNWDSDAQRCWIWSESFEFVVTLFEYVISRAVNKALPNYIRECSDNPVSDEIQTGLDEFLKASTLERISEKCPEIKMIANLDESNLDEHARKYLQDLVQYLLKVASSDGTTLN